jgi:hypothetical protein
VPQESDLELARSASIKFDSGSDLELMCGAVGVANHAATEMDSDSDLELMGETSAAESGQGLTPLLSNVRSSLMFCRLLQGRLKISPRSHSPRQPAFVQLHLNRADKQTIAATTRNAQQQPHATVMAHGSNAVDGAAWLTLRDDTWLQVCKCNHDASLL